MLSDRHNAEGDSIFDTVQDTSRKLAAEYWRDNQRNIIDIVANSFLKGYDSYNIRVNFINAVSVSIGEKARINMEYMSQLTGKTEQRKFLRSLKVLFSLTPSMWRQWS